MEKRDPELEARLKEAFKGCCLGGAIHAYAVCDSTMERAHALAREGAGEGTLVFAARQTQGRGRLGRKWESPEGGAYFSLILRPTRPPTETPQLSLVAGLSAAEVIHEAISGASSAASRGSGARLAAPLLSPSPSACGLGIARRGIPSLSLRLRDRSLRDPEHMRGKRSEGRGLRRSEHAASPASVSVRWPNDVLIDGKKVAGILTEASSSTSPRVPSLESRVYVVLGIGINVTTDPKDLPDTATSLAAGGASCDPHQLSAALCSKFDGWYDIWTAQGFAPIRAALRSWLSLGGIVRLTVGDSQLEGQATDVDDLGRLLVRLDSGVVRAFEAGEVTLLH